MGRDQLTTPLPDRALTTEPFIGMVPAVDGGASVPRLDSSIGNRLFGERPVDLQTPEDRPDQLSELRTLRVEVDRLRGRLAREAAYRTELEAALTVLTGSFDRLQVDDLRSDAFERFINAEDPEHEADRDSLLR